MNPVNGSLTQVVNHADSADSWSVKTASVAHNQQKVEGADAVKLIEQAAPPAPPAPEEGKGQHINVYA